MTDCAKNINAVFSILSDKTITLDELTAQSPCNRHETTKIMSRLVSRGAVERLENGVYKLSEVGKSLKSSGKYQVFHSGCQTKYNKNRAVKNSLRDKAWRLMRLQNKFTITDLVSVASDGKEKDPRSNLLKYVNALCHAGILYEMPRRLKGDKPQSNGYKQFMLIEDVGHKTPILRREKKIYDPNSGETLQW